MGNVQGSMLRHYSAAQPFIIYSFLPSFAISYNLLVLHKGMPGEENIIIFPNRLLSSPASQF